MLKNHGDEVVNMAFLFIGIWFSILGFIFILAHLCGISMRKITTPQIFLGLSLIMSFLGYPILFFQLNEYRKAIGLTDPELIMKATLASGWSIIGVIIIYRLLISLSSKSSKKLVRSEKSKHDSSDLIAPDIYRSNKVYNTFWFIVLIVCFFVLIAYLSKVQNIALLEAFAGGNVAQARSLMTNDFKGSHHWYRLFFYDLSWLSSLALFAGALQFNSRRVWMLFGLSFFFVSFCLLMTAQKAPMIFYLGTLFLLYSLLKNNGVISIRSLVLLFVMSVIILVPMYFYFMGRSDLLSALNSIVSRGFTGQLSGAYNYQWIFPQQVDYLSGRSFPNPKGLLPFEHFPLSKEVMAMMHPQLMERGIVGSQPTIYWGEVYANFGWIGVFVAPIYVGIFIFFCNWLISIIKEPIMRGTATVWIGFHLGKFAYSGFSWSLLPLTIGIGFITIFCWCLITTFIKQILILISGRNQKVQGVL